MLPARPRGETGNGSLRPVIASVQPQAWRAPALPPGTAAGRTSDLCGLLVCLARKRSKGGSRISPLRQQRPPLQTVAALLILREKVIKPVLAGAGNPKPGRPPKRIHPLDVHYENLQCELRRTFETLGLAA